ncbi:MULTISPECIES: sigma-70 family RNA polymerase sigma factor [Psychrobacillus]|uniref:Sigma-70 family RNA polymerase sigma factor n=1 Tax=Psychrobacillus psychrodurans TaxID=126157 RepID=A0A9X3LB64_9BACI|nr:sigma-70 family RNA polymerase sigma factor [Psychrobacillus psychrodurans]MCZ8534788.1 sigma-70 family RNA polymerase sigma factor [Psychrobacillus psychrodurans]
MEEKLKLIVRAKRGDAIAFQQLIHLEKEKLYKMAYVYMRNEDEALEVFQETVYLAFKSITKLKNDRYFSTWIIRILINTSISTLRKKKRFVLINEEMWDNMPGKEMVETDVQIDLMNALNEMDEKYKTVLLLRYYQDYTIQQIAVILGCPEGTVKTNIRRGITVLKEKMKGVYKDDRQNSIIQGRV